jgi:hypothetical protein
MMRKLIVILCFSLPQINYSMVITRPKKAHPPLEIPILENYASDAIKLSLTYYYLVQNTSFSLFGPSKPHTHQENIKGPTISLELQSEKQITVPVPTLFQTRKHKFTQEHLVGFKITAHSASQQKLAIITYKDQLGTPHLQVKNQ